jgi:hypothetical protein
MKVKIKKCSNNLLWYSKYIGQEFEVRYVEDEAYWTREIEFPYALNWIYSYDAEITDGNIPDL